MADYDAKIKISADTSAAERSLQNLESKVNNLVNGLDIGKKVGRSFTEAFVPPQQLKQLDRELATIASRADTVAKRFARVVEGVGTIGVAAKGISDIGVTLQQLSVNAQQVAANFNNANAAARVLTPGFNLARDSANSLSKSVGFLEYKFNALVPGAQGIVQALGAIGPQAGIAAGAVATIGVALETVLKGRAKQLETEVGTVLKTITDQTQQLLRTLEALNIPLSGTVRQFQNLLRTGEERLANVSSYSDEARRALSTILTGEIRLTAELQRQAVLRREMEASRFASVAQRTGMQFTFGGPKALPMAGQTAFQGAMRGGLGGGARSLVPSQTEMLVNATGGRASRSGIEARATTASLQFGTQLSTEVDKVNALSAAEKARTKEINARLLPAFNEQRVREGTVKLLTNEVKLNESNLGIERALNGERARGVRYLEKQTAEEQRQVQLGILGQKTNKLPGQIGGPAFPSAGPVPLGMYGQGRTPIGGSKGGGFGKTAAGALSNAAVGGAFPLLFGQSGAASAGGAIGGVLGSVIPGIGGFGGSLIGTIIGEKAGQGNKIKELAADIGFSTEQTKLLATAFKQAGQDFDKFQQSVSTIQGLSLSIEDQAKAIQLASSLTESYGGKIDKVTNAFASALSTGKVTQGTLNQLTNNGIEIQQALADKYKISRSEVLAYAKDGKISVQDLIDTLVEVGNKGQASAVQQSTAFETAYKKIETAVNNLKPIFESLFKFISDQLSNTFDEVSNTVTNILTGIETFANVVGPVFQQLSLTISRSLASIKIPPWLASFTRETATSTLLNAVPGGAGLNFLRQVGKDTRQNATKGRYTTPDQQTRPKGRLDSFSALGQLPPSGGSSRGVDKADKAAKAAEREAARVANIVRDQAAITEQKQLQAQYSQALFTAEVAKDEVLKIQLQREQQLGAISIEYSKKINDEKAKGNSAAVKEAFTKTALVDVQLVELKTAQELAELQIKTTETYTNIISDLDYQLQLKTAVTEQDRIQLQIAYEAAKLKKDNPQLTQEQIDNITKRKKDLAAPKTTKQTIEGGIGKLKDELTQLTSIGNIAVTVADGIGNAFANSFKSLIDGSMSAREALSSFFKDVASMFLEMAAQIIAKQITMLILQTLLKALGAVSGGGGGGGFGAGGNSFNANGALPAGTGNIPSLGSSYGFANGGVFNSPTFFKFAQGGAMQNGVLGEAGPEAVMPLSRGAGGKLGVNASGLREAMGSTPGMTSSPMINMSFETTKIGGVEYVSRDQLELAMAQTRQQATRDGAKRGMTMTLDKIQQSPQTRSRIGIK